MSRGFQQNKSGEWVPFDDDLDEPYDPRAYEDSPRKDCPWKCKPGDPKCLCEPVTNGER